MVVIGGITRLTLSGLSITEWQPVTGIVPPLSEAAWAAEFEKYQQIPQYKLLNAGMSLGEFKSIFLWEYVHRLWGRLIGFVYALPLLYFLVRRQIPRRLVAAACRDLSARLRAGRARLVHGQERPRRPRLGQPVPPRRASRAGAGDLRADPVDRAAANPSPLAGGRSAAAGEGAGRPPPLTPTLSPRGEGVSGCGAAPPRR